MGKGPRPRSRSTHGSYRRARNHDINRATMPPELNSTRLTGAELLDRIWTNYPDSQPKTPPG